MFIQYCCTTSFIESPQSASRRRAPTTSELLCCIPDVSPHILISGLHQKIMYLDEHPNPREYTSYMSTLCLRASHTVDGRQQHSGVAFAPDRSQSSMNPNTSPFRSMNIASLSSVLKLQPHKNAIVDKRGTPKASVSLKHLNSRSSVQFEYFPQKVQNIQNF